MSVRYLFLTNIFSQQYLVRFCILLMYTGLPSILRNLNYESDRGEFKVRWGIIAPEPRFAPYFLVRCVFLSKYMSQGLHVQKENHGSCNANKGHSQVFWGTSDQHFAQSIWLYFIFCWYTHVCLCYSRIWDMNFMWWVLGLMGNNHMPFFSWMPISPPP